MRLVLWFTRIYAVIDFHARCVYVQERSNFYRSHANNIFFAQALSEMLSNAFRPTLVHFFKSATSKVMTDVDIVESNLSLHRCFVRKAMDLLFFAGMYFRTVPFGFENSTPA